MCIVYFKNLLSNNIVMVDANFQQLQLPLLMIFNTIDVNPSFFHQKLFDGRTAFFADVSYRTL